MPLQPDEKMVAQAAAAIRMAIFQLPDDARHARVSDLTDDELRALAGAVLAASAEAPKPLQPDIEQRARELLHEATGGAVFQTATTRTVHEIDALRAITKALASSVPEDLIQSSEREMIVKWLRAEAQKSSLSSWMCALIFAANRIDRGEHLPPPPEAPQDRGEKEEGR